MTLATDLRPAWLDLAQAEALARAAITDMYDEWQFIAELLSQAGGTVYVVGGPFEPVEVEEVPSGSCLDLTQHAAEVLRDTSAEGPRELTLAFITTTDALRAVRRRVGG